MSDSKKRRRIGFLTVTDPSDRRNFSGTYYFMLGALRRHCGDVEALGPVEHSAARFLTTQFSRVLRKITGHPYYWRHSVPYGVAIGSKLASKIRNGGYDVIVCPTEIAAGAFIGQSVPLIYLSDATHAQLVGYYETMTSLSRLSHMEQHYLTRRVFKRSRFLVFSSRWACNSAINDYGADPDRTHCVSFGANTEFIPSREDALGYAKGPCTLVFLGCDWERKGGPVAYEALKELLALGVPAKLIIIGCTPKVVENDPQVVTVGYLDRNHEKSREEFIKLMASAHFTVLPTRAECTPISFCESNAYGMPVVTSSTGGIASVITEGVNGFMLPVDANGKSYAEAIKRIWDDPTGYLRLRESSRKEYETRLNWDAWGRKLNDLMESNL